ncbi:MAG: CBS domain-containing protein [Bacteroidales bacterium]|nr:CBS domain-containing protein [Bacteroidales bacterium]
MIAKQLISDFITPLSLSDTGAIALSWMDDFRISHLPVTNKQELIGIVSEKDVFEMNDFETQFINLHLSAEKIYIYDHQHIFDVFRLIFEHKLTVLPVLDSKKQYLGCIAYQNIIEQFAQITSLDNPGGVNVLEMSLNDYSASEIAQIVESNDAKILSMFVTSHSDSTRLEVSLKINKIEIGPIIQTFNRYDYLIKASYMEDEDLEDLRERYDSFMKYLSI